MNGHRTVAVLLNLCFALDFQEDCFRLCCCFFVCVCVWGGCFGLVLFVVVVVFVSVFVLLAAALSMS